MLQVKLGKDFIRSVFLDHVFIDTKVNQIAHVHVLHIHLQWQCTRVLHGVEKDWGNHSADDEATGALVWSARNVLTHVPQDRVCGGLPGGSSANNVSDVSKLMTLLLQICNLLSGIGDPVAGKLQHGQRVQRNVGTRPSIRSRRQVICIRFAGHFKHTQRHLLRNGRAAGEPVGVGPRLNNLLGEWIALLHLVLNVVVGIEEQDHAAQGSHCAFSQLLLEIERLDQRGDVVSSLHPTEHLNSISL
mmetsp:Transcript_42161/g.78400  ORF Transcript_42161/g.78400 Transcript_42161/m.78400 type:complete len:245 (-) Transcript_42161:384-1118(-)